MLAAHAFPARPARWRRLGTVGPPLERAFANVTHTLVGTSPDDRRPVRSHVSPVGRGPEADASTEIDYEAIAASPEFRDLRRRHRRFVFPMCALFFCWFMLYVLLAAFAHDFMSYRLVGNITVGLVFGLLQFVSTAGITMLYVRFAKKTMDPRIDALRERVGATRQ